MARFKAYDRMSWTHSTVTAGLDPAMYGDTESRVALTIAGLMGNDIQGSVSGGDLLLETLGALIDRSDVNRRRDDGYVTFGIGIRSLDCIGKSICGEPSSLNVVGPQRRGEHQRLFIGVDSDDLRLLGGIFDRLPDRNRTRRYDDDRRWLRRDRSLQHADLAIGIGFGIGAQLDDVDAEILSGLACTAEHGLPESRAPIPYDDGNCRFGVYDAKRPL
jgi:hypothetical protein